MKVTFFTLLIIPFLIACHSTTDDDIVLHYEGEDSEYVKEQEIGDHYFNVRYQSPLYQSYTELLGISFTQVQLDSLKDRYNKGIQFVVSLSSNPNSTSAVTLSDAIFDSRTNVKMTSILSESFKLEVNGEILPPSFFHIERGLIQNQKVTILLGFSKPQEIQEFVLIYNDLLLGVGKLQFRYNYNQLSDLYIPVKIDNKT